MLTEKQVVEEKEYYSYSYNGDAGILQAYNVNRDYVRTFALPKHLTDNQATEVFRAIQLGWNDGWDAREILAQAQEDTP